jgi:hypothetical protein
MTREFGTYGRRFVRLWPWPIVNLGHQSFGIVGAVLVKVDADGGYYASATRPTLAWNRRRIPLLRWRDTRLAAESRAREPEAVSPLKGTES